MVGIAFEAPAVPALIVGHVAHTRHRPKVHSFTYRHYHWLVDVDALPRLPRGLRWIARFDARDHLDGARLGGGIRGDVERYLANRGVAMEAGDQVLMLAHARMLAYASDSLSAFWIVRANGTLRAAIVEVHNTYGERHAYLLSPEEAARATVEKAFYVSPFNDMRGVYEMRLRVTQRDLTVGVRLVRDGKRVVDATVGGAARPATFRAIATVIATHGLMPQVTSLLIRLHAVVLWARQVPTYSRPIHAKEAVR
jgi:hypothetical protein